MEAVEVDPRDALREGKVGSSPAPQADQAPEKPDAKKVDQDVIDTLVPKAEPKTWKLSAGGIDKEYVQRPLSFFAKMQFFSLVGEVIDKSISGNEGLRISSFFEMPGIRGENVSASDFRDADTFIQAVGKLLTYAPDFLEKCYCIWLAIPDHEREWAKLAMGQSKEDGGLSDDDGIEIIEIFIDQNWESLEDFFRGKIASLRDRVESHRKEATTDE